MNSLLVGLVLTIASVGVDPKAPAQSHVDSAPPSSPWIVYGTIPPQDDDDATVLPLAAFKDEMECMTSIEQHKQEVMERFQMTLECKKTD